MTSSTKGLHKHRDLTDDDFGYPPLLEIGSLCFCGLWGPRTQKEDFWRVRGGSQAPAMRMASDLGALETSRAAGLHWITVGASIVTKILAPHSEQSYSIICQNDASNEFGL